VLHEASKLIISATARAVDMVGFCVCITLCGFSFRNKRIPVILFLHCKDKDSFQELFQPQAVFMVRLSQFFLVNVSQFGTDFSKFVPK
jgi:hypothetical protein